MSLIKGFENSGNWLFRWRSYLPLLMLGICLIALRDYEYPGHSEELDHYWEVFCLLVSAFGLMVRVLTVGYAPKGTSGRNTKKQAAESLNTTGMYSIVRNPLYLGNFFMWLGIVFFAHLWWLVLIYISLFWLFYERIIFAEEVYLQHRFGDEYDNWAVTTPVFIPKPGNYKKPDLAFSLRNILRREYNGFFAVILVMFLFETLGDFITEGKLEFDTGWLILFGFACIIWFFLRTLKKYTSYLNVEGR